MKELTSYTLLEPIEFGSEKIERLEFKPLKAKHLRAISTKAGFGDMLDLAAKLTGLSTDEIDMLGAEDTMRVVEIVGSFFANGQKNTAQSIQL